MILAIESSSSVCSVSLQTKSGHIIDRWTEGRTEHSKKLVLFIGELLEEASGSIEQGLSMLQKVIISNGPGSYTGLRIAGSALRGVLFNRNVDVWAASTLAGIACSVFKAQEERLSLDILDPACIRSNYAGIQADQSVLHAVIDARGGFSYYQPFLLGQSGLIGLADPKRLANSTIQSALNAEEPSFLVGTGWANFTAGESKPVEEEMENRMQFFHARNLLTLLHLPSQTGLSSILMDKLEPYYLGNNQVNNTSITTLKD
ncbi:MAG: tRNA (adenosine(37)-N6)-threonylcarbamoyltransferase complex dimerization subunit type 1 TsaB [Bacteroidetes bacterium]|nr:tRNA (adenosine(37)-N6)-threonylcarbamoyltransferase complex dimerization subunit type 1 TsaB [Bacteroidota bacterium]MDA1125364.1 tRNA (adenosine(37)-N6)-threonylcarbamoyltransferase complex dimerization subunit type 1 TsaB [Bacteroidota bacterium]